MKRTLVGFMLITVFVPTMLLAQIGWTRHTITGNLSGACSVHAQDINGDDNVDVLGTGFDASRVCSWLNDGGDPISWTYELVQMSFLGACFVSAEDIDGDGDIDVLSSAWHGNELAWWENGGGDPIQWTKYTIATGFSNAHEISAADMDGDEDIDVLGAAAAIDEIAWFENDGLVPIGWTRHTIDDNFDGARSIRAADFDGDSLIDVVGAALLANAVTWWRNNGDSTWTEYPINQNFVGAHMVCACDIDTDGDTDVAAAAYNANDITWWRNDGGSPINWTQQTIDGSFYGALGVFCRDINNDGHIDVLGTSDILDDVAWWSNDGSIPISWTEHVIDGNCDGAWPVYAEDIDGDGDVDVVAAATNTNTIYWYESDLVGVEEDDNNTMPIQSITPTIVHGPLRFPGAQSFQLYDIAGREIKSINPSPGVYFLKTTDEIIQKIVKVQ
ncbi:hypothetical protein AMJ83_06205 [candidate division WOR_3 bacterium SM23_42]|uniref:Secretion system C-terminal sorting domain-containing protein n=1 Tax=candidate division WOR_3 bacterium SM23_42 TaxID=1703779 RepID=A0A0S8FVE5_UNCW3|nr:MAG: hypothetical protein AMJ83_06205 [candidate division WOR_3 bacterium SM23_42]